jgi:hypothetical protein
MTLVGETVEAAPEEVDGTGLAQIAGTEALQHAVDLDAGATRNPRFGATTTQLIGTTIW